MTYPPGTRVRVTFEGVVDGMGNATAWTLNSWPLATVTPGYLAANPDKVTVLLDEPADNSVVLDRYGVAWQRIVSKWFTIAAGEPQREWQVLTDKYGPLTVIHAGGSE